MLSIPENPWLLLLSIVGSLAFGYAFVSFWEHQFHRNLMHKQRLPKWIYRRSQYLWDVFEAHAVKHHVQYYHEFDHEPDPAGKEHNLDIKLTETAVMVVALLPLYALMIWVFPLGGSIVLGVSVLHNRLWNLLHREMHIPQNAFFKNWPMFRFLARHHFMHHQQMNKNYNVVFPLFDYLMGTVARPELGDIREMLRLGYLEPRHPRTQQRLDRWRQEVAQRRQAESLPEPVAAAS